MISPALGSLGCAAAFGIVIYMFLHWEPVVLTKLFYLPEKGSMFVSGACTLALWAYLYGTFPGH